MLRPILFAAFMVPGLAFAAGDETKPTTTETTGTCTNGQVWDTGSASCVNPQDSRLDTDELIGAVREFAYVGQYDDAQRALRAIPDQNDDRVLTYWGFTTRKMGDTAGGMVYYRKALVRNPANILARSYMGQALVIEGDLVGALTQLRQIRSHGGAGTWAETSLRSAIETGTTYDY
ncbi:tetratricopeptide repeat protein [Roseovarius pelagicus]|uniref:Tetratricopeptide repeat-containing protein n=1 Tax=Roseovarius pelagicus TaxID=2980108 RepID=A0ABY6DB11_9RHOB|nr:hypothetical protein [Roseovarius pelagicus]UXX82755.1 hypothetical protein N7U68_16960 [Roseovarius pelagicus]